ncbi:MAG: acyl carrier protein phosphodiesterase, partial [Bacteroidota bacterium]
IVLHREIDTFTDAHPIPRQSSKRLHKNYSHYSGVIVDIYYDHFLAKNWSSYSEVPLATYVDRFYELLENNYTLLPEGIQRMMPYMISDNWLLNYANLEGIAKVLRGMDRRTQNRSGMHTAVRDLEREYDKIETEFTIFFTELTRFAKEKYQVLCAD